MPDRQARHPTHRGAPWPRRVPVAGTARSGRSPTTARSARSRSATSAAAEAAPAAVGAASRRGCGGSSSEGAPRCWSSRGAAAWGCGAWAIRDAREQAERARAEEEASRRERTVAVTAARLLREFQDDPAAADRKYKGKYLEVSGLVERVGRTRSEAHFVILHGGDRRAKVRIECFFPHAGDEVEGRLGRLGEGQTVTVRGEYGGRVSNVQMRDCVLVE